jgi:hypothetical protein
VRQAKIQTGEVRQEQNNQIQKGEVQLEIELANDPNRGEVEITLESNQQVACYGPPPAPPASSS